VVGIDVAEASLALARERAAASGHASRLEYHAMNALALGFEPQTFDLVACVQNGISAFRVDASALVREAWRVLAPGGCLAISTYAGAFWPARLAWFEVQADAGLIGLLDRAACRDGIIACTDGFRSGRATAEQLRALGASLRVRAEVFEVDDSSLWCLLRKPGHDAAAAISFNPPQPGATPS
jgi:2-polyprenyl-6-hydroxyphenyl methylase/3-demethylubiquinone-9 3-methyltransferase